MTDEYKRYLRPSPHNINQTGELVLVFPGSHKTYHIKITGCQHFLLFRLLQFAKLPCRMRILKYSNMSPPGPPMT